MKKFFSLTFNNKLSWIRQIEIDKKSHEGYQKYVITSKILRKTKNVLNYLITNF